MMDELKQTADYLIKQGITRPEIGIVLGTGLGKLIQEFDIVKVIEYRNVPNFPVSTVEHHSGKLVYGRLEDKMAIAMQGRFHYYEGYSAKEITFPVRVMVKGS